MKDRLLPVLGSVFWLLGLILFLAGINIHTDAGTWLTVIGSIVFLLGPALEGVVWFHRRDSDQDR